MIMQATSLGAYKKIKKGLGLRQKIVYDTIDELSYLTNSEIARTLNWSINRVTPRVFELREKDLVAEDCKRKCTVTGHMAIAWRIKRPEETTERQTEIGI